MRRAFDRAMRPGKITCRRMTRFVISRGRNKAPISSKDLSRPFAKDGLAAQLVDLTAEQTLFGQVKNRRMPGGLKAMRSLVVSMSSSGWHTSEDNFLPAKPINQKSMQAANHGTLLKTSSKTSSFGVPPSLRQLSLRLGLLSGCRHNVCFKRRVLRRL
jgi:hypothetical protein